jgi:hypothetical protein
MGSSVIAAPRVAQAQSVVHGADSLFKAPTVKLAWAMVKGATEEATSVIVRVVNVTGAYRFVRADGIDPFTKARTTLAEARPLANRTDLSIPRARFADFPSLEIFLDATIDGLAPGRAALTVYYLGVPDTTPEFLVENDASTYLEKMLAATK